MKFQIILLAHFPFSLRSPFSSGAAPATAILPCRCNHRVRLLAARRRAEAARAAAVAAYVACRKRLAAPPPMPVSPMTRLGPPTGTLGRRWSTCSKRRTRRTRRMLVSSPYFFMCSSTARDVSFFQTVLTSFSILGDNANSLNRMLQSFFIFGRLAFGVWRSVFLSHPYYLPPRGGWGKAFRGDGRKG